MPARDLPSRPNLTQLKLQAKELRRAHAARNRSAAARVLAHHPKRKGLSPEAVLDRALSLADAQLVLAREYGFDSWASLKHRIELAVELGKLTPHPRFAEAVAALDAGDLARLRALLAAEPELVHARTNLDPQHGYFAGATLLHHVAGNPWRDAPLPANIVDVARLLLDAGADVNAASLHPNGGTTMGLLLTSKQASDRNVTGPLVDVLLQYGASLELEKPDVLDASLANHAPCAAEKLIELGAKPDIFAAAALGRIDLLHASFDEAGRLRSRPRRRGKVMGERDAIGLALLYACVRDQRAAVDFLLEKDGNWNMTGVNNGTALHRAAFAGDLAMVQRLVAKGADTSNRDNPFNSTPLSWAQHNRQHEVCRWLREHCTIDLHDAVCFDLREHVHARLREDPAASNRRLDQWEIPQCTPLHWAAWLYVEDVEGTYAHDPAAREQLVLLLLEHGADPNIVAGNGLTPLDIAHASPAPAIAALLQRHGGKPAAEL
jgi:ankyrin repeat protein